MKDYHLARRRCRPLFNEERGLLMLMYLQQDKTSMLMFLRRVVLSYISEEGVGEPVDTEHDEHKRGEDVFDPFMRRRRLVLYI